MHAEIKRLLPKSSDQEFWWTVRMAALGIAALLMLFLWCVLTGRPWPS